MIRETFRCNTGIIFDAAMLQQLGLNLCLSQYNEVQLCLNVPLRLSGTGQRIASAPLPQDEQDVISWVDGLWRVVLGTVLWPIMMTWERFFRQRTAMRGWISDTARVSRGREVLPGRMDPVRAQTLTGEGEGQATATEKKGKAARRIHPHAVDVSKFDPMYEAREERADARSALFDQLGAASGASSVPCRYCDVCLSTRSVALDW